MNNNRRPSFWRRLFLALVKTFLAGVILILLAVGGYLVFMELRRSFDSTNTRVEINRRDIDSLRDEINEVISQAPAQQQDIGLLQAEAEEIDTRLNSLQMDVDDDLERQQELLAAMEERLTMAIESSETALSNSQTANEDAAALGTAMVALQGDFNETNGRIDALGGEIDALRAGSETVAANVNDLSQSVDMVTEATANVADLERTLALFHVWELVTRARLRLIEDNAGLATADLERAFRAIDVLLSDDPGENEEELQVLQTRLALTLSNLPDDLVLAANDLESVWDQLDAILTAQVLPDLAAFVEAETAESVSTEEATPPATLTPTPTPSP